MKNTFIIIIIALLLPLIIITNKTKQAKSPQTKPTIALSTFSLYEITRHIADDSADIFMILPFGVDAHSYEPAPKQVIKLYKSDLVVYSGAGLEPWINGFEFQNRAIDMSLHVDLKGLDEHGHEHHHNHEASKVDPHYWLDFLNMIKATKYIADELIEMFPKNRELYIKNRDSYVNMLMNLDADYRKKLSTCKLDTIVVNHNAFSYLSSKYGFEVEALSGLSPEAEPSAKSMANLIEHVKEHKISTIFFESFVSDKAIRSIADEAKVDVDVLQPLGNLTADEAAQKLSYEDIMRSNLEKISRALKCQ
ncbi:MAG: zinc ABC transporter substrate-binding protein [Sulfurimonas sp.]|nr:zinc ABC transporter substrate-binding protein [Sulfurimonas sp.]